MPNPFAIAEQADEGNPFAAAEEPQVNEWGLPTDLRHEDIPVARKSLTDYPLGMTRQRVEEGPPPIEEAWEAKGALARGGGKGLLGSGLPGISYAFPGLKPTEEEMPGANIGSMIGAVLPGALYHRGFGAAATRLGLPRLLAGAAKSAGGFGGFELGLGAGRGEPRSDLIKRVALAEGGGAVLGLAGEVGRGIMGARREIAQTGEFGRLMQEATGRPAVPAGAGRPIIPGRPRPLPKKVGIADVDPETLPWIGDTDVPDYRGLVMEGGTLKQTEVVPIKSITITEKVDRKAVDALKKHIQAGAEDLPPPVVERDAEGLFVVDGGNRLQAARELGYKQVPVREYAQPTPKPPAKPPGAPVAGAKPKKGVTPAPRTITPTERPISAAIDRAEAPAKGVFSDAAEAAKARLRARSAESQRGALGFGRRQPRQKGASLTQDLKDYSIIGADIVDSLSRGARGKAGFRGWSLEMTREFGDDVKPYLRQVWKESNRRWRRETKLGAERGTQRLQRSFPETPVAFRPIDFQKAGVSPEMEADLLRVGSYHYGLGRRDFGAWLKAIRPIVGKGAPDDFLRSYFDRVAAGEVPALDIGDKLSTIISDSKLTFEARAKARAQLTARQTAAGIAGRKGLTGRERHIGSRRAMKAVGTADFGDLGGVGKQFAPAEQDALYNRIEFTDAWDPNDFWNRDLAEAGLTTILERDLIPEPGQLLALDAVFGRGIGESTRESYPWMKRLGLGVVDVLNARRALMASADVSATLRQGAMLGPTHPVAFKNAFRSQFKVLLSERNMEQLQRSITSDPLFRFAKTANLYVAPWGEGATLAAREEIYLSHFADRFPHVRASNRAYVGFLNKLRFDSFKQYYKANPDATPQALESYARFINYATGRGSLGQFQQAGPTIAAFVFAPRYTLSRPQSIMAMGQGPNEVKVAVAKSLGRWGATVGTVLALADLSPDVDVETDPLSTDALKVRVGNTRFDLLSGHQQNLRYAGQVAWGMVKDRRTGKIKEMPDGWGYGSRASYIANFMKSKASPLSTDILEAISRKTFKPGETVDFSDPAYYGRKAYQGLTPMNVQDAVDAAKYSSDEIAVITAVATILGVGAITYEPD